MELEKGRPGQFEILADGQVVASRKGGLLALLLRRPFPEPEQVLESLRKLGTSTA